MMTNSEHTGLYRFFAANDALLYVGISNCLPRRIDRHEDEKPWFTEVARVTVQWHVSRQAALAAEKIAIQRERPRYNVVHNGTPGLRHPKPRSVANTTGAWVFETHRSGFERAVDLWLYPELDGSSMVDDYHDCDGEDQLDAYVEYIREGHPEWWRSDAVPIYWSVRGDTIFETAPFQAREWLTEHFLTFFTWPYHRMTGEMLDWYQLPVRNDRFPEFAKALAWTPSPLQPTCPLRRLMHSRKGIPFHPLVPVA